MSHIIATNPTYANDYSTPSESSRALQVLQVLQRDILHQGALRQSWPHTYTPGSPGMKTALQDHIAY